VLVSGDTSNHYLEVVGVVKDFNQKSLLHPIDRFVFYSPNSNIIQVKLNPGNIKSSINWLKTSGKIFPALPFEYKFLITILIQTRRIRKEEKYSHRFP
jgi:putative ABC transport system permease protein